MTWVRPALTDVPLDDPTRSAVRGVIYGAMQSNLGNTMFALRSGMEHAAGLKERSLRLRQAKAGYAKSRIRYAALLALMPGKCYPAVDEKMQELEQGIAQLQASVDELRESLRKFKKGKAK